MARSVGETIKRLRKTRGFTFDAFVEETGLGRGYVSELERGLVIPTIRVLDVVAKALELTMADLVLRDTPREQLFRVTADLSPADVSALLERASGARGTKPGVGGASGPDQ